jgi:hypothetical protein
MKRCFARGELSWKIVRIGLLAAVTVVFLAGCTIPGAMITSTPTLNAPAQSVSGQKILFKDDFSNSSSGWDTAATSTGETNYSQGAYRIWVNEPYTDLWANPGLQFEDTRIEVKASKAGGPDDNVFGLICRSDSAGDKYYYFVVSSDGFYGIGKVNGAEQHLLSAEKMMPSEAILQGKKTNLLRADCIGDQLAFYVNGQKVAEVQDGEYPGGDIGLTAGSFDKPDVDIRFDDLVVFKP